MREGTGKRHLLEKKSSKLTRRYAGDKQVAKSDVSRMKKMLGL